MRRLSSCLIAASLFAAALPAAAQQPPPRPNTPPPLTQRVDRPMIVSNAWTRAEYETFLDAASGNNLPTQPLERVDLANRVSTLIELGRCTDARNEAREAGDPQMALRARQICRADANPAG
ncbi:hypothetical protein [Brevundimonas sp.]|uniref:hypothetical protein n=1 Tax=Brevundimonas sp. TaxID=1871086 RepID=UPI002D56B893|nr:hypothetical protein [Brevundimonas sp.]HYC97572.1 hypothetical protein [Brevundimonas sp.]